MADEKPLKQSENECWDEFEKRLNEWHSKHPQHNYRWQCYTGDLDLSECDFTDGSFPADEFVRLQEFEIATDELKLYNCSFAKGELPRFVCALKRLKKLDLCLSNVSKLPDEFANLQELEVLYIDNCDYLRCFPKIICQCKSLKVLNLENYFLNDKTLPDDFANLQKLEELNVAGNFSEFPQVLLKLPNLKDLIIDERLINEQIDKELKARGVFWHRGF